MIPIRDHWVAATPGSNNEDSVFYDWGLYSGRPVPGWIGTCMPWYIYCPVMWAIMCKYRLSRGQPYMQGLSWGQPGQVSNVNNEFSCVTAVSVDTRGIWLCSDKQQGEEVRKDTFYVQGEVRESPKAWGTAGHQALSNRLSTALTVALSLCRRFHQIQLVTLLHPWAEGRSTVLVGPGCLLHLPLGAQLWWLCHFCAVNCLFKWDLSWVLYLQEGTGLCVKLLFISAFQPSQAIFFPTSVTFTGQFIYVELSEPESLICWVLDWAFAFVIVGPRLDCWGLYFSSLE